MVAELVLSVALFCGCGGGGASAGAPNRAQAEAPAISTTPAKNGAVIVHLNSATTGAAIHYTVDGATPTNSSQIYEAPFLVASRQTVKAIATASGDAASTVTSKSFTVDIPSGTLVWSDEFNNSTGAPAAPTPSIWTYDTGGEGFGNHELENYCAWGSNTAPCSLARPSAYVGVDGYLHIVAQQPSPGVYTSARLQGRRISDSE
ncbi:MAG: FN3 associated domain-containing protein [Terracidiphilus sp.]